MNEKEFNLAIFAELKRIANEVFSKVKVSKEGTYTAAELWNEKDAFGESIVIDYKGTESEIYIAEIGTFKMQVTPQKLWYVLWKFEKLCNVRQADKIRFTYGEAEHEIVNEKAMYYTGSMERGSYNHEIGCCEITGNGNYKVATRKTTLKKLSDKVAEDKKGRPYYKSGGIWYMINDRKLTDQVIERISNDTDYLFGLLEKYDFSCKWELTDIYKALYCAMKSERVNNTPEQIKCENEPENTVICNVVIGRKSYDSLCLEQMRLKSIGNSLYKDDANLYFRYGIYCYCLGCYTRGVATFLKEQGDNIQDKIREMIDQGGITTESANILYGEICKKDATENPECEQSTNEDYPPEPYNVKKPQNIASLATFDAGNVETSGKRMKARTICNHAGKSANSWENGCLMLPGYLRQKVFPTEVFYARRKISRFKPRYFVGYTNYHIRKENSLERKRNGNTSVYMVLIRGETKNNNITCR